MAPRSWPHASVSLLLYSFILCCHALPTPSDNNGTNFILSTNANGTVEILDPATTTVVAQGSVSDGAGSGMDLTAVLWLSVAFVFGIPLLSAGVRLSRFTSGTGLGLGLALGIWASIVNAVNVSGISDIATFIITAIIFAIGFIVGFITIDYGVGSMTLALTGGMSLGVRIVLFRENLLVPIYSLNWLIITLISIAGLILAIFNERAGVFIGSSAAGSFLVFLAIDLLVNKQSGMSLGLRYLFDRNSVHLLGILGAGYKPPVITIVLLALSIAAIPAFAILQHKLFPRPFWKRSRRPSSFISDVSSIYPQNWVNSLRGLKRKPNRPHSRFFADDAEEKLETSMDEGIEELESRGTLIGHRDRDDASATVTGGSSPVYEKPILPFSSRERLVLAPIDTRIEGVLHADSKESTDLK